MQTSRTPEDSRHSAERNVTAGFGMRRRLEVLSCPQRPPGVRDGASHVLVAARRKEAVTDEGDTYLSCRRHRVPSEGRRMPINSERLQRLEGFGLTEYQARAYLALLDLGTATASQLPALSRVPRTRIYSTMRQLHAKG